MSEEYIRNYKLEELKKDLFGVNSLISHKAGEIDHWKSVIRSAEKYLSYLEEEKHRLIEAILSLEGEKK